MTLRRKKPPVAPWITSREVCWDRIRDLGTFQPKDLIERGVPRRMAIRLPQELARGGVLEVSARVTGHRTVYTLVNDVGQRCPRVRADGTLDLAPTSSERMWAVMRTLPSFTTRELAHLSRVPETHAKQHVNKLYRAGYVGVVEAGNPHRAGRWGLVRNTGPKPPAVGADGEVYDRNLRRVTWRPAAAEPAPEEVAA